jgi:hypothetical protein
MVEGHGFSERAGSSPALGTKQKLALCQSLFCAGESAFLHSRRDENAGALREFLPEAKGERREAGSRNFSVRKNIRDRVPLWAHKKIPSGIFLLTGT